MREQGGGLLERITFASSKTGGTGKTALLGLVSTLFQGGSRLISNILIGRLGGAELLGLIQNVTSTASLAALFLPTPGGSAASRFISFHRAAGEPETAEAIAKFIAARVIQATFVIAIVIVAVTLFLSKGADVTLMTLLMVLSMCGQALIRGMHYGTGQVGRLVRWDIVVSGSSLLAVAILLASGVRSVWLLAPMALVTLTFVIISWPYGRGGAVKKSTRRNIDRFMLLGVVGTVSSTGFLQSSVLVATSINGLNYAGQYSAALTLTTPVALVAGATSLALFPAMAGDHGRKNLNAVRERTGTATRVLATLTIPIFAVIGILAQPIILAVWGSEFVHSDEILILLLLAVITTTIAVPSVNSMTSESNWGMAASAASSLAGFAVGAISWIVLAHTLPRYAVPIGYLVGATTIASIPYVLVWRKQRQKWLGETFIVVFTLAGLVAAIFTLRAFSVPLWGLVLAAVLFVAAWCAVRVKDLKLITQLFRSAIDARRAGSGGSA